MTGSGWIKLYRQIQTHWLWEEKPFDKRSAWIDIILRANHKPRKVNLGNELIEVERGEFITSQVKLADRWGWSRTKVRNFLELCENDGMLEKQVINNKRTHLKVCNYGDYQSSENRKKTGEKQEEDRSSTGGKQVENTDKNVKNVKNEKNELNNNICDFPGECIHPDKKCHKGNIECEVQNCPLLDIFQHYRETFDGIYTPRAFGQKRKSKIKARLQEYSVKEIKQAITNICQSDYHIGESKNNDKFYAKIEFVCRNDEKVEEWLNYQPKGGKNNEQTGAGELPGESGGNEEKSFSERIEEQGLALID